VIRAYWSGDENESGYVPGCPAHVGFQSIKTENRFPRRCHPQSCHDRNLRQRHCAIDAIGYQARNDADPNKEKPTQVVDKGITMGSGQAPVKKYNEYLRDLIVNGRAKPSKIVSHHIRIEDAPDAYEKFDKRIDGYTKVAASF
jgi:hypothetical protein